MITQKLILVFALLLSVLQPVKEPSVNSQNHGKNHLSYSIHIDSIKQQINSAGWTDHSLRQYEDFLLSLPVEEIDKEKDFITSLKNGFERSYLFSFVDRKAGNYQNMFDTLFTYLDSSVAYLPYYDQIVYSAQATNGLRLLEAKIENSTAVDKTLFPYLLSLISSSRAEYNSALNHLEELNLESKKNPDILFQYFTIFRNSGDYEKAYSYLKLIREIPGADETLIIKTLIGEGALLYLSGKIKEAEKIYYKALSLSIKSNNNYYAVKSLIASGICDDMNARLDDARSKFSKALKLAQNIGDEETQALAYSELGVSYTYSNDLIEAKNNYELSFALYKKTGNKQRLSLLSDNIGKIYISIYDYKSALKYYEQGLELAGENKRARILNLTGLADIYSNMSNYSKALKYYREARELSREIKEVSLDAEIDKGLGVLNYNLNKYSNALQYFSSASANSDEAGNLYLSADISQKLGLTYLYLDSLTLAEKYLNSALNISHRIGDPYTEINSGLSLVYLYLKSGKLKEAGELLNKTRTTVSGYAFEYELVECDLLEGQIQKISGNFNAALSSYRNALAGASNIAEKNLMIEANYRLALEYDKVNLNELAESYYSNAVKLIEDRSRSLFEDDEVQISYFSSKSDVFNSFAEFYLNRNNYTKAFELIEKSRSRNTMQNLSNLKIQSEINDENILKNIYEYDWIINSGLYESGQVDSVNVLFLDLKNKIAEDNPSLKKYLNFSGEISIEEIQKNLYKNEHIVSYFSTADRMYAFSISNKKFAHHTFDISRQEIKKLIAGISPYYAGGNESTATYYNQDLFSFNVSAAADFYTKLVSPFVDKIPEGDKIIFTSSGMLEAFPFEFLVTEYNQNESSFKYAGQKYFLYRNNISYAPSASVYIEQKQNEYRNNNNILLVGNPAINTGSQGFAERRGLLEETPGLPRNIALLPLKYSLEEVNQIGEVIDADRVLVDNNATETNFKANAEFAKVIHLSTHSFLFNKQPVIFFSNSYDAENDGFLEASEIVQMKLNSDLVVLSSCISGLGQVDESEGIIGMTKAFFEAGSKSVVVSLWDVNDKYTSKLMGLFYKKLSEGFDKSEALRLAKIDFIKEHSPNPYYWGAFVLAGNTNGLTLKAGSNPYPYLIIISLTVIVLFTYVIVKKRNERERNLSVPL